MPSDSRNIEGNAREATPPATNGIRSAPKLAAFDSVVEHGELAAAEATVCITLYNYAERVTEALESVFSQTMDALGLVVVDDASTDAGSDRTRSWMEAHADRFAGMHLVRHRRNQGLAGARNSAVALSRSEYVMILDADNLLYPRCVGRLLASLSDSEFGFAYSILEVFGERIGLLGYEGWSSERLKTDNYIDAMAMIRRSVWVRLGGYSKMNVPGWEDYDFWCKCAEAGLEGLFVPEILARYRVHRRSMLHTETNELKNKDQVCAEMVQRHPWLEL